MAVSAACVCGVQWSHRAGMSHSHWPGPKAPARLVGVPHQVPTESPPPPSRESSSVPQQLSSSLWWRNHLHKNKRFFPQASLSPLHFISSILLKEVFLFLFLLLCWEWWGLLFIFSVEFCEKGFVRLVLSCNQSVCFACLSVWSIANFAGGLHLVLRPWGRGL